MTVAVLAVILTASFLVVGITSLAGRWLERRDKERERRLAVAVQDEADTAWLDDIHGPCFVAWHLVKVQGGSYDNVCLHCRVRIAEMSRG